MCYLLFVCLLVCFFVCIHQDKRRMNEIKLHQSVKKIMWLFFKLRHFFPTKFYPIQHFFYVELILLACSANLVWHYEKCKSLTIFSHCKSNGTEDKNWTSEEWLDNYSLSIEEWRNLSFTVNNMLYWNLKNFVYKVIKGYLVAFLLIYQNN